MRRITRLYVHTAQQPHGVAPDWEGLPLIAATCREYGMEVAEMTDAELESAFLGAVERLDAEQLQAVGEVLAGFRSGSSPEG